MFTFRFTGMTFSTLRLFDDRRQCSRTSSFLSNLTSDKSRLYLWTTQINAIRLNHHVYFKKLSWCSYDKHHLVETLFRLFCVRFQLWIGVGHSRQVFLHSVTITKQCWTFNLGLICSSTCAQSKTAIYFKKSKVTYHGSQKGNPHVTWSLAIQNMSRSTKIAALK